VDGTTPLHLGGTLDCPAVRHWITFHVGAPFVSAERAAFAVGDWAALHPVVRFPIGTPAYPDRAATLIAEVPALAPPNARLNGPGIKGEETLALPEIAAFHANRLLFPLGFDCFFTCGQQATGLPRSTRVEAI
jgi:alpha-D-ribose 1-methylphosphonate 5-triphosphate synthase subunit PhnH